MLDTAREVIKATLKADPTLTAKDRARIMSKLREVDHPQTEPSAPEIFRRADVARMLHRSLRAVDQLAVEGILTRVKLPGRTRSCGFRKAEVYSLIGEAS
ncbi:MAG: hypothetical protein EOM20_11765 [Spartobacteria bacterium]|nr:hypothetical protein [Spartobacteria bacterium]